ncbi:MAG: TPM domain-containing protein [Gallionellaceae bacterium]|nr:TPM domain-containing protein [Gallionellaceae bacterium]
MKKLLRFVKHMASGRWQVARRFPKRSMHAIEEAIRQSETRHMGELRFAVEAGLDWADLLAGTSSRKRALEVFSHLHVWDTERNSGVLIYLLLADRKVEIIADRGIHSCVGDAGWAAICRNMEKKFRAGEFEGGVLEGIAAITALLRQHFPAQDADSNSNELPDYPVTL